MSKLPENGKLTMQEAVTVSTNLVTVLHTLTKDLELKMPRSPLYLPSTSSSSSDAPVAGEDDQYDAKMELILVWGAASSVGQYALQVLKNWGYTNVIAVASKKHHQELLTLGAAVCFDYQEKDVTEVIRRFVAVAVPPSSSSPDIPLVLDCIGDLEGSLRPLTRLAEKGTKVAVMLPVINKHATEDEPPEYEMDATKVLEGEWKEGVILRGVRTHFYTHVSSSRQKYPLSMRRGLELTQMIE